MTTFGPPTVDELNETLSEITPSASAPVGGGVWIDLDGVVRFANAIVSYTFLRPGGSDTYFRPGGVDRYIRT